MKIYRLASQVDYEYIGDESDMDEDTMDAALTIFNTVKIRASQSRDISDIAMKDGKVVGTVVSEWRVDEDIAQFHFDIAVLPQYANLKIGPTLMQRAIDKFEMERMDYDEAIGKSEIAVEVVNLKLSDFLIKHFGFTVDMEFTDRVFLRKE
jgi:GNAT superfamily N-acetyltransferase